MDGRSLLSLISSTILGLLFLYAVHCSARIYIADRRERLKHAPMGTLGWRSGLARRLAVGTAVLFTLLALTATAASWSLGSKHVRSLLGRLDGVASFANRTKAAPGVREAVATAPAGVADDVPIRTPGGPRPSSAAVRRPEFVVGLARSAAPRPDRRHTTPTRRRDDPPESRSAREPAPRGEWNAKAEGIERTTRAERPDLATRVERRERVTRIERTERVQRPERVGRRGR